MSGGGRSKKRMEGANPGVKKKKKEEESKRIR